MPIARFAKAYDDYNANAIVQQQMARVLKDNLPVFSPKRVLEIGVGTGNFTQCLLSCYQDIEDLYLNDCYERIKHNHLIDPPTVHYVIGDINDITLPKRLDLITANAVLQWIYPLEKLLNRCHNALNQGGYLVFSSFGTDNLKQIRQLTKQGLIYYQLSALSQLLNQMGFVVQACEQQWQTVYFTHPRAVLEHLKHTGVTGVNKNFRWSKSSLQDFCQNYEQFADNYGYPLTYHPLYIVAQKC